MLALTTPPTVVFPQYANGLTGDTRPSLTVAAQIEARLFNKSGATVAGPFTLNLAARIDSAVVGP